MNGQRTTRRDFLKAAALGASSLAVPAVVGLSARGTQAPRRKPNLLFLWTDEQRADTMAAYGNRIIRTPNLDKLAAESIVFERAYVTQPVCTPNRSAVMTGLWPHASGCTQNNIPLRQDTPCLPELLADPDYRTANMGKWHLGDEIFAQHGFQEWVSMEYYDAYYRKGRDRSKKPDYHDFLLELGYRPDVAGRQFSRGFAARRPIEHCKPRFLESRACDFLRRNRAHPFVLHVNFLEPHMPFFGPLDDLHPPEDVDLPDNFGDPLEENEPLRYRLRRDYAQAKYGDARGIRALIARYYGLVSQVDRSVGAILATLDDLGLADETIVVYTSDHGDMMGSHHMVEKCVMYEEAARIPWLIRIPQMEKPARTCKAPVSHIDMVPTLLDLLGCPRREELPGQSLVPLIRGGRAAEDHVFIQWNPGQGALRRGPNAGRMASAAEIDRVAREHTRTVIAPDGWKLCLSDLDKCQLFHLAEDPGETTNLFDSPRHADVIGRLSERIHRWQDAVDDDARV